MPLTIPQHALRERLNNEVHARPSTPMSSPLLVTNFAVLTGERKGGDEIAHLRELCRRRQAQEPAEDADHHLADCGAFRLKWERHTEFSKYTFLRSGAFDDPFSEGAEAPAPTEWLSKLPGDVMVATRLAVRDQRGAEVSKRMVETTFGVSDFAAATVEGGAAAVFTDFRLDGHGFTRFLVADYGMDADQCGRLVQRLLEIDTYRMMALLAFPVARETQAELSRLEARLSDAASGIAETRQPEEERALLADITGISAEAERLAARTSYRFAAAAAYDDIVLARLARLDEHAHWTQPTIADFLNRRLAPAMKTCRATAERMDSVIARIGRASSLLRTRVDVALEEQNANLLKAMNTRAMMQLRLQQTVEGLSVVAISYYAVGLTHYVAEAAVHAHMVEDAEVTTGLLAPFIIGAVWWLLRRARLAAARRHPRGEH